MRVITFSKVFPATHPRKGQSTFFVEKIWQGLNSFPLTVDEIAFPDPRLEEQLKNHFTKVYDPKWHTIRGGNRWKVGDWFSPRIWSGKPYQSKQIQFTLPIQIKKIWTFRVDDSGIWIDDMLWQSPYDTIAINDGLNNKDFIDWLIRPHSDKKPFIGQIICWNESIDY